MRRRRRKNPSSTTYLLIGVVAVGGYLAYAHFKMPQVPAAVDVATVLGGPLGTGFVTDDNAGTATLVKTQGTGSIAFGLWLAQKQLNSAPVYYQLQKDGLSAKLFYGTQANVHGGTASQLTTGLPASIPTTLNAVFYN